MLIAIGYRDIESSRLEVVMIGQRRQPNPNVRIGAQAFRKPGLQQLGGETWTRCNHKIASLRLRSNQISSVSNHTECAFNLAGVGAPRSRENGSSRMPLKQRHTQKILELLDVVTDRRRCDREVFLAQRKTSPS